MINKLICSNFSKEKKMGAVVKLCEPQRELKPTELEKKIIMSYLEVLR